jgi:Sulfotransferase family
LPTGDRCAQSPCAEDKSEDPMVDSKTLTQIETLLFERYSNFAAPAGLPMVFILGAPRSGSTLLYQLLINVFGFFYISNWVSTHFFEHPVVGAALDHMLNPHTPVAYSSNHGKTEGLFGPSEASLMFRHWFGGKHPAQRFSAQVLPGKSDHLRLTMQSLYGMTRRPILTKNAWNCFRIRAYVELFPAIQFVWIRRDIAQSAWSDLKARFLRGGPTVWNSATTENYRDIQKLPYWEQVVEQQYEYNEGVAHDLACYAPEQYCEVWYEDICQAPAAGIDRLRENWEHNKLKLGVRAEAPAMFKLSTEESSENSDLKKIREYVFSQEIKFRNHRHTGTKSSPHLN